MKNSLFRAFCIQFLILITTLSSMSGAPAREPSAETRAEPDFIIQEEMTPMRDGVRLYTLILSPKDTAIPLPVILLKTPYNAKRTAGNLSVSSLKAAIGTRYLGPDYIYVFQDIRGRFKSEGDYFMYRAPKGPFNTTTTDETTDAWDSIDWLVKMLSTNGRVGIWGTSYPGWLTLAAMRDPHPVLAKLFAETTGSDADWVVKLIDVYAGVEEDFVMSGFQLMISGDIFRGRYREDFEQAVPIAPDTPLEYRIPLPQVNHTFLPGHRIMVQVQSTWFPLYDLNPQTFVPSIMTAPDSAYKTQRHRIHHSAGYPTAIMVNIDSNE